MRNAFVYLVLLMLFPVGIVGIMVGCHSNSPSSPLDTAFSPTPTPIARITGSVQVAVVDKGAGVAGLTVEAIPPSGSTTFSAPTTTTGIATFNPPYLEVGTWTFVIPAQTPFPYAPSTVTMGVTQSFEEVQFTTSGATLQLTPPVPSGISGTNGGIFLYGLSYNQGSLLVPVTLKLSQLPSGWNTRYGPTTIGYLEDDTAAVTVTGSGCVDEPAYFSVTALDLEPTPYPRAESSPQTIAKNFTSTVTVTWSQPNFNNYDSCNLVKQANGTLTVSSSNSCATVRVWINEPSTNCTSGYFDTPNGNTNAEGGVITFSPGNYSCSYYSDGGFPAFHASCGSNGATGSASVGNGSFTVLNTSY